MFAQAGIVLGRILLRLLIRLAPFILVALAALFRRYRWPIYYRMLALKPAKLELASVPAMVLWSAGGLALTGVALYLVVTHLAPQR
jgi:hypothetical protein